MEFITNSPEETRQVAINIASRLKMGTCIALIGDMGAGKTVFVQGLAQGLGVDDYVSSPTFSLMNEYDCIYHFDLYRLTVDEILDAGLDEFFYDKRHIAVVEWPSEELMPQDHIRIKIEITGESTRKITVDSNQLNLED